ncbi:MAG: class I SAM-dependent methyltransferase [Afipia sp.]|nr:class I SAM-dependent methyltransferase [Afipia sp.]
MTPIRGYAEEFFAQSGKVSDKWSSYLPAYNFWLSALRDQPVRILEIGVQNGGHLEVLSRYFRNAEIIVGCDINTACAHLKYQDHRIKVVIGDVNKDSTYNQITALSTDFDIIIDDGSHTQRDIIVSYARYFPRLKLGGVYIAEDLHTSYWRGFEGGLFDPFSSLGFFRKLVDLINIEHWRNNLSARNFLGAYERKYKIALPLEALSQIHAIAFQNSICIILKKGADENQLGPRIVAGTEALVDPNSLPLAGSLLVGPDESANPLSSINASPEFLLRGTFLLEKIKNSKIGRFFASASRS